MKKLLLSVLAISSLIVTTNNSMEKTTTKAMVALLGAGAVIYGTEFLAKNSFTQGLCKKLNLNTHDVKNVVRLSGACFGFSLFTHEDTSVALREFSWKAPAIGLVYHISTSQIAKNIIGSIPVVGEYLVCKNPRPTNTGQAVYVQGVLQRDCEGSCQDCQLTNAIKIVALWDLAKYVGPQIMQKIAEIRN